MTKYRISISTDTPTTASAIEMQRKVMEPGYITKMNRQLMNWDLPPLTVDDFRFVPENLIVESDDPDFSVRDYVGKLSGENKLISWDVL